MLVTVDLVMTIGLSVNGCLFSKKLVWRWHFTRITSPRIEVQAEATLKVARDSSRACPFLLLDQEDKEASADRELSDFALGPLYA